MSDEHAAIQVDVAVIGAGFSGLQAALDIGQAGLTFVLLEAHDRVGGKSLTTALTTIDDVVEMGPTWINDKTQPRMYDLVKKYGLGTIEQYLEGLEVICDGDGVAHTFKHGGLPTTLPAEQVAQLGAIMVLIETEAAKFETIHSGLWINDEPRTIPDVSVEEFLQQNDVTAGSVTHIYLTVFCRGMFGIELNALGMHFFLDILNQGHGFNSLAGDHNGGAQYLRIKEGTSSIAKRMAGDLPSDSVLLSSPVLEIRQRDSICTIMTETGRTVLCKKVILTIASHTFHHIQYTPSLPQSKLDLASSTLRGHYAKSILTYSTPWWRELGLAGKFSDVKHGPVTTSWELSRPDKGQYSLAVFTAGAHYDAHFTVTTSAKRKKAILDHLAEIVDTTVGSEKASVVYSTKEFTEQDWYSKEYIEGAPMAAFGPNDFARLAPVLRQPFQDIHFAGTETARQWKGYMEGAIEAGQRAAGEVVELLLKGSQ